VKIEPAVDKKNDREKLAGEECFLFSSDGRELVASGIHQKIMVPAFRGDYADSDFQKMISTGLEHAYQSGQVNPIVVGAIPFNTERAACLYIPERYEWKMQSTKTEESPSRIPKLVEQKSTPDENGFKHSVQDAITKFHGNVVKKSSAFRKTRIGFR